MLAIKQTQLPEKPLWVLSVHRSLFCCDAVHAVNAGESLLFDTNQTQNTSMKNVFL